MNAAEARWLGYMEETLAMFAAEAERAYVERKAKVWEVYAREGVKPWMQWQVAPCDLPFKTTHWGGER